MLKKILAGTIATGAALVAIASPASAHAIGINWGCQADGTTQFAVATWHYSGESVNPANNTLVVDGVEYPFTGFGSSGAVPAGGGTVAFDPSEYFEGMGFLTVAITLAPGTHTVNTGGYGSVGYPEYGPHTITTGCGAITISDLKAKTSSLAKSPVYATLANALLDQAARSTGTTRTAALNSYISLVKNLTPVGFTAGNAQTLVAAANALKSPVSVPVLAL